MQIAPFVVDFHVIKYIARGLLYGRAADAAVLDLFGGQHGNVFKRHMATLKFPYAVITISDQDSFNKFIGVFRIDMTFLDKLFEQDFTKAALGARIPRVRSSHHAFHTAHSE